MTTRTQIQLMHVDKNRTIDKKTIKNISYPCNFPRIRATIHFLAWNLISKNDHISHTKLQSNYNIVGPNMM